MSKVSYTGGIRDLNGMASLAKKFTNSTDGGPEATLLLLFWLRRLG